MKTRRNEQCLLVLHTKFSWLIATVNTYLAARQYFSNTLDQLIVLSQAGTLQASAFSTAKEKKFSNGINLATRAWISGMLWYTQLDASKNITLYLNFTPPFLFFYSRNASSTILLGFFHNNFRFTRIFTFFHSPFSSFYIHCIHLCSELPLFLLKNFFTSFKISQYQKFMVLINYMAGIYWSVESTYCYI